VLSLNFAQLGHWLEPMTGSGWLRLAQPMWSELAQPKNINKKYKK
jgi:hypothetical protein